MRIAMRAAGLLLFLLFTEAAAFAQEAAPSAQKMRAEDRLVLVLAVVGSVASVGIGAFVHWKLLRGGDARDDR